MLHCNLPVSSDTRFLSRVQPIRVEVAPGQVEICQVYEMEQLLTVASMRIATMYHNNPVSSCCTVRLSVDCSMGVLFTTPVCYRKLCHCLFTLFQQTARQCRGCMHALPLASTSVLMYAHSCCPFCTCAMLYLAMQWQQCTNASSLLAVQYLDWDRNFPLL